MGTCGATLLRTWLLLSVGYGDLTRNSLKIVLNDEVSITEPNFVLSRKLVTVEAIPSIESQIQSQVKQEARVAPDTVANVAHIALIG